MKKLLISLLLASISFTGACANEKIETPIIKIQEFTEHNIDKNTTTLYIDCRYKMVPRLKYLSGIFSKKEYFESDNELTESLCENQPNDIVVMTYGDVAKEMSKHYNGEEEGISISTYYYNQDLNNGNSSIDKNKMQLVARVYKKEESFLYSLNSRIRIYKAEIKHIENLEFELKVNTKKMVKNKSTDNFTHENTYLEDVNKYVIKKYDYDLKNNKIINMELNEEIKEYKPVIYTNSYDIDEIKECIDGIVWIKKYGNTAGDKCDWKER